MGDADTFVLALEVTQSNTAQVAYATYLGGTGHDRARSLAPIADGRVFVAGHTNSTDFPASADAVNPPRDFGGGFIVRLDPNGVFERGTFIGRAIKHFPNGLKYEASNSTTNVPRLYVTGTVHRNAFPGGGDATNGAFQTEPAGDFDAFVGSIDSDLTHYNYFTLLGGSARDIAMDLAVSDGYVFVTGATSSENFPVTEAAAQTTRTPPSKFVDCRPHVLGHIAGPCFDAFVTRLNRAGANLIYSTYYGFGGEDFARGIALDSMKRAFITGASLNRLADAETDIFVTKFEAGGASALSETFLRAGSRDHGEAITVDDDGRAHVVGTVSVDGLATGAPVQSALAGDKDIFYARLSALGATEYFTYYGGENADRGFSVDTVASGEEGQVCVFIAGASSSENLATGAALQSALASSAPDLLLSTLCDIPFNPSNPGSFSKTSSTGVVQPGQEFSYTISLLNSTDQTAPAVSIIDAVPIELQVLSVLGPNGCSFSANNVSCTITVPPGQTSITIGVKAKSTCNLQITNTAKINVLGFTHESSTSTFIACPPAADLCGNGTRDSGEQCDDGNRGGRDGCNAACQTERCGDGDVDPGEQCDDSNQDNNDACSTSCIAQTPLGGSCGAGPGSLACPADTVCGKNCSSVNDCAFPFFLFPLIGFCPFDGDSYEVCTLPECMPPTAGVRVVG
jgi:uncharacterized repeat protein (TIGR01451 family)